ncbi:protein-L-isoaspartate(D-aspartate) O-methyltransferase [Pontibacter sp. KCTC 32443]|uniref:protein-L-isoaspartate(D-aspartate) O-methyltransferase n=1 Tax=Pontibacter TaxID=323449 RepID=UPI00164E4DCB|nr:MULTISPECIES: protein-L-isoaspartate(D-aspartate) O-methyltransferase [Pontibacter]MBC5773424.1 protein-L-isoaspartate(D-aspartate) O-methyltransferase [Pontibacter sp. KCTC 32443]
METDLYKHKGMRRGLVQQLRQKGIRDERVLAAIETVPRHFFFDKAFVEQAYQDKAFPIGEGQTISQPYTVAFQTELLRLKPTDKVLEIGTGSGYQCCVLLQITPNVYTIEFNKPLYEKARRFFTKYGLKPYTFHGDGSEGLPMHAPYDKIIVTAGAPVVPRSLLKQLNVGGILVIPVGNESSQKMLRITRTSETGFEQEEFADFKFVPLLGREGWNAGA